MPPEPNERELIVRATHVEAPSRNWADDEDDHADEAPEPQAPATDRGEDQTRRPRARLTTARRRRSPASPMRTRARCVQIS